MQVRNDDVWLAGVDSCPKGWIAVFVRPSGQEGDTRVFSRFSDILSAAETPVVIAVDIPIGLPKRAGRGGRAAEETVRSLLTTRRPSVFSVPSRCAIYAEIGPFKNQTEKEAARRRASIVALATSDPPRKITIQSFAIFPKIREVDRVMRSKRSQHIFEVHPEIAFWLMNGKGEVADSKKTQAGAERRKKLLIKWNLPTHIVDRRPPQGAAADDLLDALACAAVARRIHAGLTQPFPDPPPRDAFGLAMAIWA
jgi:predicted RNase H-like nuclease